MRQLAADLVAKKLQASDCLAEIDLSKINYTLTWAKSSDHGHFACNIALLLAKPLKRPPKVIAEQLLDSIIELGFVKNVVVAGPGFLNVTIKDDDLLQLVKKTYQLGAGYDLFDIGQGALVNLEYVSANPTGPLHVGHGRSAALGSALANVFQVSGYKVHQEYYVNDAGRQMQILGLSCLVRSLQQLDMQINLPEGCYQGDYIKVIAKDYLAEFSLGLVDELVQLFAVEGGKDLDELISSVMSVCGDQFVKICDFACDYILSGIGADLVEFRVDTEWFFEKSLFAESRVEELFSDLKKVKAVYEKDGALWFKASDFGDEKDRVLQRSNGQMTYFAADAAYHRLKLKKFDQVINIWGADHHGYVPRMRAVLKALGLDDGQFECLLVQFVSLVEGQKKIAMSTRAGAFVTLQQLINDVGVDVCRFFYLLRRTDQHMEFDLDLARKNSQENPVYYIQYACARINSILQQVDLSAIKLDHLEYEHFGKAEPLVVCLAQYSDVISGCVRSKEVCLLASYLQQLAAAFHKYYSLETCLVEDLLVRNSRAVLLASVRKVLKHGLGLLGVGCPDSM